ncbi:MAG: SAM-dependent methyltransferase, partial [Candidatus Aminicenantes bacterium]|nr:SAM-dependent methyltransferase [Candidatus Aminicenantes bacterium]
VEAFRRIVRYEWYKSKQPLTFEKLRNILKNQIAGIELNEEAARITAFSLYLSLLHYLDPPAIDQRIKRGNKLPNLVVSRCRSDNHFHCILPGNAFDAPLIESDPYLQERFGEACADIVIGNPPWGSPGPKADSETKRHHEKLIDWCASKKNPIGDEEPSQAFLWRALYSLKEKGNAGMLVSTGVLFKHNTTSLDFRQSWLSRVKLSEVFNFSHARNFFFKGTIAPFLFISFSKENQGDNPVYYWSAKQAANIKKTQAIVFSRYDLNVLHAGDLTETSIWKELWFGRPADREFLRLLRRYPRIGQLCNRIDSGQGFKESSKTTDADILQNFKYLDIDSFSRYDSLAFLLPPKKVERLGILSVYEGHRLLVKRGIQQKTV